jgi:hypothetical protein
MALNPFFLQGSSNEQYLIQDLINEQLKIYGIDVYYLPRKFMRTDNILNEVETSKFDDNFILEAYLENYEGYAPGSDLMTKFGLRLKNEINLIISRERFEEFIVPLMAGRQEAIDEGNITDYDMELISRPKEGDLIYFPLGERLFEIKRVEFEKPFYQLGKNYVYELQCELYEYENEDIDTSIEEIDTTVEDEGYITSLILGASQQTTATANSTIDDGVVSQIVLVDDGSSYSSIPTIGISSSPTGNSEDNATAVAITTSVGDVKSIKSIRLTFGGRGYNTSNPPLVTITGGGGTGAAATSIVSNGAVNKFTMANNGAEYYSEPTVTVTGPSVGQTATAKATFNSSTGKVTGIQIVNAGFGYTQAPTVQISAASTISIGGTYIYNETVTGSLSGTTAEVRHYNLRTDLDINNPPGDLRVAINSGQFSPGEIIVGSASSARYILKSYDNDSYEESYDKNEEFETEADSILDFTEVNPFGEF